MTCSFTYTCHQIPIWNYIKFGSCGQIWVCFATSLFGLQNVIKPFFAWNGLDLTKQKNLSRKKKILQTFKKGLAVSRYKKESCISMSKQLPKLITKEEKISSTMVIWIPNIWLKDLYSPLTKRYYTVETSKS